MTKSDKTSDAKATEQATAEGRYVDQAGNITQADPADPDTQAKVASGELRAANDGTASATDTNR